MCAARTSKLAGACRISLISAIVLFLSPKHSKPICWNQMTSSPAGKQCRCGARPPATLAAWSRCARDRAPQTIAAHEKQPEVKSRPRPAAEQSAGDFQSRHCQPVYMPSLSLSLFLTTADCASEIPARGPRSRTARAARKCVGALASLLSH